MQPSLEPRVNQNNVSWTLPAHDLAGANRGSADSMPLGNGDVALNVWTDAQGDLLFYIAKSDAWSQDARLLKLGRVRVKLSPNPLAAKDAVIRQTLNLFRGRIEVALGNPDKPAATLWVWVDANAPVVHVEAQAASEFHLRVELELWRHSRRKLEGKEVQSAYGLGGGPNPVFEEPDTLLPPRDNLLLWCHRNERSMWHENLKHQGLEGLADPERDPLLGRTFGGTIGGPGLVPEGATALKSSAAKSRHSFDVFVHTAQTPTLEEWADQLHAGATRDDRPELRQARGDHERWWRQFWGRSFIEVSGSAQAKTVSQGYALQRFINACAGGGQFPIKFNGSLFTADWNLAADEAYDADYRRWGGPYWFQNTRLPYWTMLAAGDFEMLDPLFDMFLRALPFCEARTQAYFGHGGAFFPETMYFWGAYADENYGWDRTGKPISQVDNTYIRWYWSDALELLLIMLERYAHVGDAKFMQNKLLPLARPILRFFDEHYPRDGAGKILFKPAGALETWQNVINPQPEIAGLQAVLDRLLALPDSVGIVSDRAGWERLRRETPELPQKSEGGKTILLPAGEVLEGMKNSENAELYAIFPYRLLGLGRPGLEIARATFDVRPVKESIGWRQDAIQAALLGLTEQAQRDVTSNFSTYFAGTRFPAWWGPNFDWLPDQDHGNVAVIALQAMLLQSVGEKILLFPAWPKDWDVRFRLHAPGGVVVEGEWSGGKAGKIVVTPRSAAGRVEIMGQ